MTTRSTVQPTPMYWRRQRVCICPYRWVGCPGGICGWGWGWEWHGTLWPYVGVLWTAPVLRSFLRRTHVGVGEGDGDGKGEDGCEREDTHALSALPACTGCRIVASGDGTPHNPPPLRVGAEQKEDTQIKEGLIQHRPTLTRSKSGFGLFDGTLHIVCSDGLFPPPPPYTLGPRHATP